SATDAEIRRAMGTIARDETRHAALAWSIASWAWRRLDDRERARVVARARRAIASLDRDADVRDRETLLVAGLPDAERRRALVAALSDLVWRRFRTSRRARRSAGRPRAQPKVD